MTRQLAFPFHHAARLVAADFLAGPPNEAALAWLQRPQDWPGLRLALFGEAGCGKTHLLHVFAQRHGAVLVRGETVHHLLDMPARGAIAVDDADTAPDPESLLHLLNAASEAGLPLLLAGRTPPSRWTMPLPDLTSRLRAITPVAVGRPDEAMLRALLGRLLAERQLRVDPAIQDYLLARLERHGAALREAASCLDRLSLASGGRVNRAIAGAALALLGALDGPADMSDAAAPDPPCLL